MPNNQKLKTTVKRSMDQKHRLRFFDAGTERTETSAVVKSRMGLRGVDRKPRSLLSMESKMAVSETNAISGTTGMSVQNRYQKPLHPLSHQLQEVEVRREKRASEEGIRLGRPIDSFAKTT